MRVWVIPDPHWYHNAMVHLCGRPENHTQLSIANWKVRVSDGDMVIVLGDVIFKEISKLRSILNGLPGNKILVSGNHDKQPDPWYRNAGFMVVVNHLRWGCLWLTHKPEQELPTGCEWNICGHVHNNDYTTIALHDRLEFRDWHLVLALEQMEYSPQPLDEIVGGRWHRRDLIPGNESNTGNHIRTIDRAIVLMGGQSE